MRYFKGLAIILGLIPVYLLDSPLHAEPVATVKAIRTGASDDVSRFVIETDRQLPYHIFSLKNPERLVIDLPELGWSNKDKVSATGSNIDQGVMKAYRVGLFKPGITRIVIDLNEFAGVKSHFRIPPKDKIGARLVVDMIAKSGNLFELFSDDWKVYHQTLDQQVPVFTLVPQPRPQDKERFKPVVVIDPGHGGVDPGAIGRSGIYEKNIVLKAAKVIQEQMETTGRYQVVLTRNRDVFIPLRKRYDIAQQSRADLFISVHADSHSKPSLRGASVYTLSDKASDKEAAALAAKENKSDLIAGTNLDAYTPEVSSILIDLAQQSINQSSWHLAEMLVDSIRPRIKMLRNPHRYAGFAVLKSPNIPSVLVELGYLSNRYDEKNLKDRAHLIKISQAIIEASDAYFKRQARLNN